MTALATPMRLADRRSLLVGGAVLAVSAVAYFRVPLLPQIGVSLHVRPAVLSLVTVVFGVGRLATDVPAGRIADRVEAQYALAGTALVMGLGSFLLAVHGGTPLFVVAVSLMSLGSYGIMVAATMLADLGGTGMGRRLGTFRFVEGHLAGAAVE